MGQQVAQPTPPVEITTLQSWLDFLLGLPFWLQTLVAVFIFVTVQVEVIRRIFLIDIMPKEKKVKYIWGVSFIVGIIGGVLGFWLVDGMPNAYWVFVGGTAGTASMAIHHALFKAIPKRVSSRNKSKVKVVKKSDLVKLPKENEGDETELLIIDRGDN